jgi:hypothetical protein
VDSALDTQRDASPAPVLAQTVSVPILMFNSKNNKNGTNSNFFFTFAIQISNYT